MTNTSTTQGIKTVLAPVSDLAAAKALYSALLGVSPQVDSEYYVGFDVAGQHLGLLPGGGPQGLTSRLRSHRVRSAGPDHRATDQQPVFRSDDRTASRKGLTVDLH